MIVVQTERMWRSHTPGGLLLEGRMGLIPEEMLAHLEEIDEAEAKRWLSADVREVTLADGTVVVEETVPDPPVPFEPRRWREVVFGPAVVLVLAYVVFAVATIVRGVSHADLMWQGRLAYGSGLLLIVLLAAAVGVVRRRPSIYALALNTTEITGRSGGWGAGRAVILLKDLDREGSAGRSLAGHLFGWQWLYSTKQGRILFFRRYFDDEVTRRLLGRLGIES